MSSLINSTERSPSGKTNTQMAKKFYGTRGFITVLTGVRHWIVSRARLIKSSPLNPLSLWPTHFLWFLNLKNNLCQMFSSLSSFTSFLLSLFLSLVLFFHYIFPPFFLYCLHFYLRLSLPSLYSLCHLITDYPFWPVPPCGFAAVDTTCLLHLLRKFCIR